jgi:2-keto-4-pentenoate hydratase/2-oxohepta-3-ene-1,7-dioic acid hydratase in catechol pathway
VRRIWILAIVVAVAPLVPAAAQRPALRDSPDTPFKLVTFESDGRSRIGMLLGDRVIDVGVANGWLARQMKLPSVPIPGEMRAVIEEYVRISPRLYQIANHFGVAAAAHNPSTFPLSAISLKAPIKYPWNLLAAAVNYRTHAQEMGTARAADPALEDPVFFAKSPRSCIVDPDAPFAITAGRNIDWEGELAIIIGRRARHVPLERAHEYVFGYSIINDISDRGGTGRSPSSMIPGPNWFHMKSHDGSAPFGPAIVPKEFLPNHANLRIVTTVNGVVKQDGNSKDAIYDEAHIVRYLTSRLTLYPGDVIATGTPAGVGVARTPQEFLRPGDDVRVEIEGIGILRTPLQAAGGGTTR